METNQEVTAQGRILHRSGVSRKDPLAKINLGDADILWNACQGAPWDVDANVTYDGDVVYLDHNQGLRLNDVVGGEGWGAIDWYREYDLTKNIYIKGTFSAGSGSGGEETLIYCSFFSVFFSEETNTVGVETSEYNSDLYFTGENLGDSTWRTYEVIYEYFNDDKRTITVLVNGKHICKVDVGQIVAVYPGVGIISEINIHLCRSFEVRSAEPWLNVYASQV